MQSSGFALISVAPCPKHRDVMIYTCPACKEQERLAYWLYQRALAVKEKRA